MSALRKHKWSLLIGIALVIVILVVDQVIKVWVKTHLHLGESIRITNWFYITFVENNGMAYGMSFIYKPLLTLFRLIAVTAIGYYAYKVVRREHSIGYVICLAMIIAGAAGNIFDCLLYGQIFTAASPYFLSELMPFGQGYAPVLQGKVVDMFYFPLIVTTWPSWVPHYGGQQFIFFSPVFNFADANISVGVIAVLLFYRKQLESLTTVFLEGTRWERKHESKDSKA